LQPIVGTDAGLSQPPDLQLNGLHDDRLGCLDGLRQDLWWWRIKAHAQYCP